MPKPAVTFKETQEDEVITSETLCVDSPNVEQNGDATIPKTLVNESGVDNTVESLIAKNDRLAEKLHDLKAENKKLHERALEAERKVKVGTVEARRMRIYVELLNGLVSTGAMHPKTLKLEGGQKQLDTLLEHYAGVAQFAEAAAKAKGF